MLLLIYGINQLNRLIRISLIMLILFFEGCFILIVSQCRNIVYFSPLMMLISHLLRNSQYFNLYHPIYQESGYNH